MSEQGDLGDLTSGVTTPQPLEVPPRADELIDEERGYQVVSSRLREGGIVLLGDNDGKYDEKLDKWMAGQLREAQKDGTSVLTMVGMNHVEAGNIPRHIDAFVIRLGEDTGRFGKVHKPGSFDYQIKITGDTGSF